MELINCFLTCGFYLKFETCLLVLQKVLYAQRSEVIETCISRILWMLTVAQIGDFIEQTKLKNGSESVGQKIK